MKTPAPEQSQRLDRWLWCARIFKTRTIAANFISGGNIRISRNGATSRAQKPSQMVRIGDTVTFARKDRIKIIEILALAARRGPAPEAAALYKDLSPPYIKPEKSTATAFIRDSGSGRPTKRERRALDALKDRRDNS